MNSIFNRFPYLSSIIELNKSYPDTDIRKRFLQVLDIHGHHYEKYEKILDKIPDSERLKVLKKIRNATNKDSIFGWHQFSDVLTEIEGYQYLVDIGCTSVEIIVDQGCPDIKGLLSGEQVLLEAKQIHNSKEENQYLLESTIKPKARTVGIDIPPQLVQKILSTIEKAKSQLEGFPGSQTSKKIIYMKITPDLGVKLNNNLLGVFDKNMGMIKDNLESENILFEYEIRW